MKEHCGVVVGQRGAGSPYHATKPQGNGAVAVGAAGDDVPDATAGSHAKVQCEGHAVNERATLLVGEVLLKPAPRHDATTSKMCLHCESHSDIGRSDAGAEA